MNDGITTYVNIEIPPRCPFCKCEVTRVLPVAYSESQSACPPGGWTRYRVICNLCHAQGPVGADMGKTSEEACQLWAGAEAEKEPPPPLQTRSPQTHELKCWLGPFIDLYDGVKTFEFRKDDRDYRVGDFLCLREWIHSDEQYTGRHVVRKVTHILRASNVVPILDGYCIISISSDLGFR